MMLLKEHYPVRSTPAPMRMLTQVKMMMMTMRPFMSLIECDFPTDTFSNPPTGCLTL